MVARTRAKTSIRVRLRDQNLRAYLALALGVVCIGFSAIFTKWAHVDGPVSGFYRVAIATVVLAIPFAVKQMRARSAGKELSAEERPVRFTRVLILGAGLAGLFFALDLGFWN